MSESKDSGLYAPLDRSRREIRLIEILSTKPKIVCNLNTVSLDEDPEFSAISYLWGDMGKIKPISNAFPEREPKSCRLWADALCINQDDDLEKGHQVQLMRFIYPTAEIVFSCLDVEAPQSDIRLPFKACETLAKPALERGPVRPPYEFYSDVEENDGKDLDWLLQHPLLEEKYPINSQEFSEAEQAMSRTLRLRYWERVWIFQELVLSKRVVSCVQLLKEAAVESKSSRAHQYFWHSKWARTCVHAGTNADETILGDMRSFLPLVGGEYGAKDPKDHVYALLGVATLDIELGYTSKTPVASVYIAVCAEILKSQPMREGWPLCFLSGAGLAHQGEHQEYELLSWVYNFPEAFSANKSLQRLFRGYDEPNYDNRQEWNNVEAASIRGYGLTCSAVFFHTVIDSSPTLYESQHTWLNFVSAVFRMIHQPIKNAEGVHPLWTLAQAFGAEEFHADVWETPTVTRLIRIFQYLLFLCHGTPEAHAAGKAEVVADVILDKLAEIVLKQGNKQAEEDCNRNENNIQNCQEFISQIRDKDSFWKDIDEQRIQPDISAFLKLEPTIGLTESGEFVVLPRVTEIGDQVVLIPGHWQLSLVRKVNNHFVHVGDCWSSRPMQEVAELARAKEMKVMEMR
ncbi:heterokaryon incompatibility protein-domain-containing protein [Fusarium sp. MPI-SDFR-AT-0072]|nr:heterokaryon incompatibility protein-domain-containing protein [Fusarium sp. MPI-SDFR-AT-0072]